MNDDFMVFSGTANLPLAEKVANYLGHPLDKIDIKHFPDGETFCQVIDSVRGRDVFVIQSGSPAPNEAYMELFIIMDALKRGSAARITAILRSSRTTAMRARTARTSRASRSPRASSRTSCRRRVQIA